MNLVTRNPRLGFRPACQSRLLWSKCDQGSPLASPPTLGGHSLAHMTSIAAGTLRYRSVLGGWLQAGPETIVRGQHFPGWGFEGRQS